VFLLIENKEVLLRKLQSKDARIGIIGLGYVGLPLCLTFVEAGFRVTGFDIDKKKVLRLNRGESYFNHISSERILEIRESEKFVATDDFSLSSSVDVLIICVPTPLNKYREPDLSYVLGTVNTILPYLQRGQIISLESTTYPGTTDEEIKPLLEHRGFAMGEDLFLIYSPEREDPGNKKFTNKLIPKVVGGITENCLEIGTKLYGSVVTEVIPVSSTKVAELTKLLENIYRAVNIGLVNELKMVADRMGIDIWEVIDAAATKPFGYTPFYPGPGLGGHCIPIDPFYLTWKAREYGFHTRFIELAGEINTSMPEWVVNKTVDALNGQGKALKGSKILVLGIAYKKNVDDMRESPAVKLMQLIEQKGAIVSYSDPYVPEFPTMRNYKFDLDSKEIDEELLSETDCVIVATDHDVFDYEFILNHSRLIVDTRGIYRGEYSNVVHS
jgi:UDP-N-acetyl-D-glucosamine dehydrogenase